MNRYYVLHACMRAFIHLNACAGAYLRRICIVALLHLCVATYLRICMSVGGMYECVEPDTQAYAHVYVHVRSIARMHACI